MAKTGSSAYPESASSYHFFGPPEGLIVLRKYLPQSTYARNVITLTTGTAFAQALPIAISPILTRLNTPAEFGVFAMYMAMASILSVLVTGAMNDHPDPSKTAMPSTSQRSQRGSVCSSAPAAANSDCLQPTDCPTPRFSGVVRLAVLGARFHPYRPDIQGLRAIAVLAVMLFHYNPTWLPGGFVGVDVFLVISGYLIVRILLQKRAQPGYRLAATLRYFYTSRIKRIVPAYFMMLILVSLLAAVLLLPPDLAIYKNGLNQAAWFHSNSYFAGFGDYFAPASHEQPLLHTWSLAVEIQFYLLAPFLVLLLSTRALKWVLGLLLVGLTVIAQYRLSVLGIQQATYYSLYARLPEFFVGSFVAVYSYSYKGEQRPWLATAGLAVVLAAAAVQPRLGPFPGLPALLPVAGAALILLHPAQGFTQRLLGSRPMVRVGELSYSVYLWHWPVLALLRYYTGEQVLDIPFSLLFLTLTLSLATLSFYGVEAPLRASLMGARQAVGYGLLTCAALAAAPSMAKLNQALSPPPLPIEYQRYADPATICHGQIVGDCLKGDLTSDKEVLVLGDSHAAMLNLFFDQLGKELGFKARIITASSCATIPGFDYQRIAEWAHKPCLEQIELGKKYLSSAKMIFLAASWNWQLASGDFKNALDAFLAAQSQTGSRIYIMNQEPLLSKNLLRAIRFKALGLDPKIDIDPAYRQVNATLQSLAARHPGVVSLNFEATGIFAQTPFFEGVPIYMDEHHLNEEGAKRYATATRSAFTRIMD